MTMKRRPWLLVSTLVGTALVSWSLSSPAASTAAGGHGNGKRTATPKPTNTETSTPTSTAAVPTNTPTSGSHAIQTVFLILMENHNWSSIAGNTSEAPYINSLVTGSNNTQTSYATQYYNPTGLHPSLPNYLWLEAGTNCFSDTGCITDDNPPSSHATSSTNHLATLLQNASISWKAYEENISDGTCPLTDSGNYAVRHDPFVYFKDVTSSTSNCTSHVRSYDDLSTDLSANTVARYNFITPNVCDDMHDSCAPTNDPIKQGDTWLSTEVPKIQASAAYKNGGAIIITWDEAATGDGPIGLIVLSPLAKGHGYSNSIHYTHSSTLRTLAEIYNVTPPGDAANTTDLSDLFSTPRSDDSRYIRG